MVGGLLKKMQLLMEAFLAKKNWSKLESFQLREGPFLFFKDMKEWLFLHINAEAEQEIQFYPILI